MNRLLMLFMVLASSNLISLAQTKMFISKANGSTDSLYLSEIKSIYFKTAAQVDTSIFRFGREFNGRKYYISKLKKTWPEAKAICEQNGGHLVTISGAAENDTVWQVAKLAPEYSQWIGLTDSAVEGQWRWITGELLTYTNWQQGEPNNQGDEDYGAFRNDTGRWWDAGGSTTTMYFILEIE